MDLKKFIEANIESGYITAVLGGAESSVFYPENIDMAQFIKQVLDKSDADKQQIYSQLQSGGISETQLNSGVVKKKLSFCTDFPTIINNVLTLLGYDFAKLLIALFTLPLRLKKLIAELPTLKSYEDCKLYIKYIYNILSLKNSSDMPIFVISEDFDMEKYALLDEEFADVPKISYSSSYIGKLNFMDNILRKIDKLILHKNIVLLNKDKQHWSTVLNDLLRNITVQPYDVECIDDFCIYLNDFDVGYDGSFIKQFNMLYRENYSEISPDILSEEYIENHKPHIDFLSEIGFDGYKSYLVGFEKYFKNVYKICHKAIFPKEDDEKEEDQKKKASDDQGCCKEDEVMRVLISEQFYERLSHVTLNLYIRVVRNIASAQSIQSYFGKSNRVQFIQIMSALMQCQPRAEDFTDSQREAIHYFLLTSKLLNDSYSMLASYDS